jgi:hypothetical protein
MPQGTWTISHEPLPANVTKMSDDYLPNGTKLRFLAEGPTRLAVEEGRRDELGGRMILLPPISAALCGTGIGASSGFGENLCEGPRLKPAVHNPFEFNDVIYNFSELSKQDITDFRYGFFVNAGAKPGAKLVDVTIKYKGVSWTLWLKSPGQMLSETTAYLPGKNNVVGVATRWQRV